MKIFKNFLLSFKIAYERYVNFYIYFFEIYLKILIKKRLKWTYITRNNLKFIVRLFTYDTWILDEIIFRNVYNCPGYEIKNDDTVIDIGAHIGVFTIYAASKAKNGKVFSFEPLKDNYLLLKKI